MPLPVTAFRAFHHKLIDYAGLFPPAKMPLMEAIREYAEDRVGAESWMLGKFIIQTAKLKDLAPFAQKNFHLDNPWLFSALGRGGDERSQFLENVAEDAKDIAQFHRDHAGSGLVQVYEVKLPEELIKRAQASAIAADLAVLSRKLDEGMRADLRPFIEVAVPFDAPDIAEMAAAGIAEYRHRHQSSRIAPPGFKLRTGGTESSVFPPVEMVAAAIHACAKLKIPMKFTAGLHHPVRHFNTNLPGMMHGFLNIFGAAILAWTEGFGVADLRKVLAEQEEDAFRFVIGELRIVGHVVHCGAIERARESFATSFGSCSFDEPREDLRQLKMLY